MINLVAKSASRFRVVLAISLLLSVAATVSVAIYGLQYLNGYADEVNEVAIEASNSDSKLTIMQQEAANLERNANAVERAQGIVAESKSYQYQDLIISDLEGFARQANVRVLSYDFTAAESAAIGSNKQPSGAKKPSTPAAKSPSASGPKSTMVNITLTNPVDYRGLLQFIHLIEQNITRMQIANITMSGNTEDPNSVTSSNFMLQVYIR